MDFLSVLLAYATIQWVSDSLVYEKYEAYCQNLYWKPESEERMSEHGCDIYKTDREIARIKSGKY